MSNDPLSIVWIHRRPASEEELAEGGKVVDVQRQLGATEVDVTHLYYYWDSIGRVEIVPPAVKETDGAF